jgi:hypothetical protein
LAFDDVFEMHGVAHCRIDVGQLLRVGNRMCTGIGGVDRIGRAWHGPDRQHPTGVNLRQSGSVTGESAHNEATASAGY